MQKSKILLSVLLITRFAFAGCEETLQSCDRYIQALEKERSGLVKIIDAQNKRLEEAEKPTSTTPWYEWLIIGAAGTIVLERMMQK